MVSVKQASDGTITPNKKSVKFNAVMNTVKIVANLLFPLITFPYTSRILGPAGTGNVNFALSFVGYFSLIASLGIPLYGMREVARCRDDKQKLSNLVHELLIIHLFSTVFIFATYVITIMFVQKIEAEFSLFLLVSAAIPLAMLTIEWLYQGLEEYAYITIRSVVFSALSVISLFIFIHDPSDYIFSAAITIFSSLGSSILNFWNARKIVFANHTGDWKFKGHARPLLTLFLLNFITSIYLNLDTVMLGFLSTPQNVGFYTSALKLTKTVLSAVGAFGVVIIPRLSYYVSMKMHEEFNVMLKKSLSATIFLCLPITVGLILLNRPLLLLMAGETYLPASDCVVITAPIILFIGLTQIFGMQILYPLGKERLVVLSVSAGAIISFILNLVLIPRMAHIGAAWATLAAECVVLLMQILIIRQYYRIKISFSSIAKPVMSTAVMAGGIVFSLKIQLFDAPVEKLIVSFCIGAALYLLSAFLLKDENFNQLVELIQKKRKKKVANA